MDNIDSKYCKQVWVRLSIINLKKQVCLNSESTFELECESPWHLWTLWKLKRWNVLYLADPNWVFSRWRRRFAHRATPPTLVCFSESLYSGKFHLNYWKMTKKNLVWSQSASLFCSVQSARASFRTDSRLLSKFGPGSSVATTAKMALKSAVVKEREIQTKLKRVYFPQQMS